MVLDELELLGRQRVVRRGHRVLVRVGRRAVERRHELDRDRAVVADLLERPEDRRPRRSWPWPTGHPVVVGDVHVEQPVAGVAERLQQVRTPPGSCGRRRGRRRRPAPTSSASSSAWSWRLTKFVSKRLSGSTAIRTPSAFACSRTALRPSTPHAHSSSGEAIAFTLPTSEGTMLIVPGPSASARSSLIIVMHFRRYSTELRAHGRVGVDQVAAGEHQRDRADALDAVLLERLADGGRAGRARRQLDGVVGDLDPVVAVLREAPDRRLDGLRPHPVVHRDLHESASSSSGSLNS